MRMLFCFLLIPLGLRSQTYPPEGTLVDIGGRRLHLYCTGQGNPTVVVTGSGYSFDWSLVQPEIAKTTRICTYDPAGFAWSDPGTGPECPDRVVDLHKLLHSSGIAGPYVLAGLSHGALIARHYAAEFPDQVAGLVLIDHAFSIQSFRARRPDRMLPCLFPRRRLC